MIQLGEVFRPQNGILRAPVGLAVHSGLLKSAKVIVVDAENRVLTPDGEDKYLEPTLIPYKKGTKSPPAAQIKMVFLSRPRNVCSGPEYF